VQWYKFNLTGVDHLADCPHMVDTPGWPYEPWGKPELLTPVTDLTNPCATCLSREEKATAGYTYRDGLTAQERFLASRKRK
jgi:hypothetical protein